MGIRKKRFLGISTSLLIFFLIAMVSAEKLGIDIKNSSAEEVNFKIILYDNSGNKIDGMIDYAIKDYQSNETNKSKINSGEEVNYQLPKNPWQGLWEISAEYNNIKTKENFVVGKLEKASIKLEENNLIIENIGNVPYDKNILIYIGDKDQTARVYLEVGQPKKIRLTAPDGKYTVKVDDGTEENKLVFNDVGLTGNAVSLERVVEGSFWKQYSLVTLFLWTLIIVVLAVVIVKVYRKYSKA